MISGIVKRVYFGRANDSFRGVDLRPPGARGRPPPRPGARRRDSRRRHRRRLPLDELNLAALSLELAKSTKA